MCAHYYYYYYCVQKCRKIIIRNDVIAARTTAAAPHADVYYRILQNITWVDLLYTSRRAPWVGRSRAGRCIHTTRECVLEDKGCIMYIDRAREAKGRSRVYTLLLQYTCASVAVNKRACASNFKGKMVPKKGSFLGGRRAVPLLKLSSAQRRIYTTTKIIFTPEKKMYDMCKAGHCATKKHRVRSKWSHTYHRRTDKLFFRWSWYILCSQLNRRYFLRA